ncbi:MAG TPA: DNA repair protein RecO [Planctomycetes bacterium]|nr:DNA repair protein RecO [Planctomycetota bacterium]
MDKPQRKRTSGIIVRRNDWRESSRIVTLCTRDLGVVSALAKGAHRPKSPFLGAIDLLHVVDAKLSIHPLRSLQRLYSADVIQGNRPFRHDRQRRDLAFRLTKNILLAMPEGRPDPPLFDLFRGGLRLLGASPRPKLELISLGIDLRYLQILGVLPPPEVCPLCEKNLPKTGDVGFLAQAGGFIHRHEGGRPISARLPLFARDLLATPGRNLPGFRAPPTLVRDLADLVQELISNL